MQYAIYHMIKRYLYAFQIKCSNMKFLTNIFDRKTVIFMLKELGIVP